MTIKNDLTDDLEIVKFIWRFCGEPVNREHNWKAFKTANYFYLKILWLVKISDQFMIGFALQFYDVHFELTT